MTYKSTAFIAAKGDTNIPKEFNTVINVPGAFTKRQGLMRYPTKHIMRLPRLTSIQRGAREARSIPAATEFWTRLTYVELVLETHTSVMVLMVLTVIWLRKNPNPAKKHPARVDAL